MAPKKSSNNRALATIALCIVCLASAGPFASTAARAAQSDADLEKELNSDPDFAEMNGNAAPVEPAPLDDAAANPAPAQKAASSPAPDAAPVNAAADPGVEPTLEPDPGLAADARPEPAIQDSPASASAGAPPTADASAEPPVVAPDAGETKTAAPTHPKAEPGAADAAKVDGPLFDKPNRDVEGRLHRMYERNAEPIAEDKWDQIIGHQRAETYRVRQGNTLSGISSKLFGDPGYWPKLWSENGGFENPHLIEPGKSVRFVPGSEEDAPAILLADPERIASEIDFAPPSYDSENDVAVAPEDAVAPSVADELEMERPAIPEPEAAKKPVNKLPPSFVSAEPLSSDRYDRTGLDAGKTKAQTAQAIVIATHYWVDERPQGVGRVAEIEGGEEVAALMQGVLITTDRPPKKGERFSVVYPVGKANKDILGSGQALEVGGVIEVLGLADAENHVYRAAVLMNIGAIRKGGILLTEKLPRADFTRRGTVKTTEARVLGGPFENDRRILGMGSVVYLDAGTASGLAPGDLLAVRSQRGTRSEGTRFPNLSTPIAVAKIVHAQTHGSTAFLIEASAEVMPGDKTGGALPPPYRRGFILDRARIVDVEYEVSRQHQRDEHYSDWSKAGK